MIRRLERALNRAAFSMSFLAATCISCSAPALASSQDFAQIEPEKIDRAEQLLFGTANPNNSIEQRLEHLEQGIFGRLRSGSLEKRFQRIADALGLNTSAIQTASANPKGNREQASSTAMTQPFASGSAEEKAPSANAASPEVPSDISVADLMKRASSTPASSSLADQLEGRESQTSNLPPTSNNAVLPSQDLKATKNHKTSKLSGYHQPTPTANRPGPNPQNPSAISQGGNKLQAKEPLKYSPPMMDKSTMMDKSPPRHPAAVVGAQSPHVSLAQAFPIATVAPGNSAVHSIPAASSFSNADSAHRLGRPAPGVAPDKETNHKKEIEELFRRGIAAYQAKNETEAISLFKQVLTIDPRNVDAYFNLGSMAEARKDYVDALTYYRAALTVKPADHDLQDAVRTTEELLKKHHSGVASSQDKPMNRLPGKERPAVAPSRESGLKPKATAAVNSTRTAYSTTQKQSPAHESPDGVAHGVERYSAPAPNLANPEGSFVSDLPDSNGGLTPFQQIDQKTFQLQTAQAGLLNVPTQTVPLYGVPPLYAQPGTFPTGTIPPIYGATIPGYNVPMGNIPMSNVPTSTVPPATVPNNNNPRGTFSTIINLGANFALRSSGLHCPICRVMGSYH
jgi:tetratricopeptide (TPR) repeat protein